MSTLHTRPSDPHSRVGVGGSVSNASVNNRGDAASAANNTPPQPSPGTTILDTLKKKMNVLKAELENAKDDLDRSHHQLDEEKRRRECVREAFLLFYVFLISSSLFPQK